jgi:hypothetical protein
MSRKPNNPECARVAAVLPRALIDVLAEHATAKQWPRAQIIELMLWRGLKATQIEFLDAVARAALGGRYERT